MDPATPTPTPALRRAPGEVPGTPDRASDGATDRPPPAIVQTLERLGLATEARCTLEDDGLADLDALSELLPAWEDDAGSVHLLRRAPQGHLVLRTDDGPVEVAWSDTGCHIRPARRGTLEGRVSWEDGSPAVDALVGACGSRARTDADGRFVLEATVNGSVPLEAGTAPCVLAVTHPEGGRAPSRVVDLQDDALVEVVLEPADPSDPDVQQGMIDQTVRDLLTGRVDPDFEHAAEEAELLEQVASSGELSPADAAWLRQAARTRIRDARDNGALLESLDVPPGP